MERQEPQTASQSPVPPGKKVPETGMLRQDIQFIPPGEHGNYSLLYDPLAEHYYKLSNRSARILRMLDRNCRLDEFLDKLQAAGIQTDKEEVVILLSFMHQNSLMVPDYGVINMKVRNLKIMKEKTFFHRLLGLYMFFRLPPIYPDRFFTVAMPWMSFVFNRYTVSFLILIAVSGYLLMLRQWNEAYTSFINSLSWANLVSYFGALMVSKTIHELSHGFTAKSFGIRVRSMGISFIVFYPRLFVDLTDTWRLSRFKRMACDGAGIASELIFGGIAAIIWVYSAPGPLHSTMFYLMTVSAMGTILVNGNPFIRYDGYYLLCDMLNIENLMQRSSEYMKGINRKLFLGLGEWPDNGDASPITLYCFGFGSFIYKFFLYTSIILLIYFQFTKAVALILMAIEFYTMLVMPVLMEVKVIFMNAKKLNWFKTLITLLLIAGLGSLLFIPLPWTFTLPCEIVPESSTMVTVKESAFAAAELPYELRKVKKGDIILPFSNVFLDFSIRRYQAMIRTNTAELELIRSDNQTMGLTPVFFEKLRINTIACTEMVRRRNQMNVIATADGIFVPMIREISPGRWLDKGVILGRIVSEKNTLYAYARDNEVNRIKIGSHVSYELRGELKKQYGVVSQINPVAVTFRDSCLIQQFGGTIACYPNMKTHEFKPVNVLYCITIKTDAPITARAGRIGLANIEQTYVLYQEFYRQLLHIFFREFSF